MEFYFDESGNLGKQDDYFVFAVFWTNNPKRFKNLVKKYKKKLKVDELKGARLSPSMKIKIFKDFKKQQDFGAGYMVVRKDKITEKKILEDKNIAYNYFLSYLVEKCILSSRKEDRITLNIDTKDIKNGSKNSFDEYIRIKAITKWKYDGDVSTIYWDSKKNLLIQVADILSNTVYQNFEKNKKTAFDFIDFEIVVRFPNSFFYN